MLGFPGTQARGASKKGRRSGHPACETCVGRPKVRPATESGQRYSRKQREGSLAEGRGEEKILGS